MNDPEVIETDRLRKRIAELEQVVRELRQKNPIKSNNAPPTLSTAPPTAAAFTPDLDGENKGQKRRVIVDRFARFKIDEAAMAAVASAAAAGNDPKTSPTSGGESRRSSTTNDGYPIDAGRGKKNYRAEPYTTYLLPGEEMVYDRIGRKTFLGAAAGKSMLRRVRGENPLHGTTVVRNVSMLTDAATRDHLDDTTRHGRGRSGLIDCTGRCGLYWSVPRYAQDVSIYDDLVAREFFWRDYWLASESRAVPGVSVTMGRKIWGAERIGCLIHGEKKCARFSSRGICELRDRGFGMVC